MTCAGRRSPSASASETCFAPDRQRYLAPPEIHRIDASYVINAAQWILQCYQSWTLSEVKKLPVRERKYWEKYARAILDRRA
jgi:hypothetical protein